MENSKIVITKKISKVAISKKPEVVDIRENVIVTDVKLPNDVPARLKTLQSEGRKWYLTVTYLPGTETPFALFCHTNNPEKGVQANSAVELLIDLARKKGILEKHVMSVLNKCSLEDNVTSLARTISLLLRHRVAIRNIVATLDKVENIHIASFLFQIKKFLTQYISDGEIVDGEVCSDCGGTMRYSEGCMSCTVCGSSKCG